MSEKLPPEPPFYDVDQETRDLLIDLTEFAIQYRNCQRSDTESTMVQSVIDSVCERFGLIVDQTDYEIEQLDNGDILWRLMQKDITESKSKTPLRLVTDNTNVTPLRPRDDSDS